MYFSSSYSKLNSDFDMPSTMNVIVPITWWYEGNLCGLVQLPGYVFKKYNIEVTAYDIIGSEYQGTNVTLRIDDMTLIVITPESDTNHINSCLRLTLTFTPISL